MIHKKVVRNYNVFCSKSKIWNSEIDIDVDSVHRFGKKLSERDVNRILSEVFGEKFDSQALRHYYSEAVRGRDNPYFLRADF